MILTTAFTPFGTAETNASEDLLRALDDAPGFMRAILPTEYERASREIVRLIRDLQPHALICFGVSGNSELLRLERVARNWDASPAPDSAGEIRTGQVIISEAPESYQATLPYSSISASLTAREIPHVFSDDAGGYVCNHTFFSARHQIEQSGSGLPRGFIHVPPVKTPEQFAMLLEAMRICIETAMPQL